MTTDERTSNERTSSIFTHVESLVAVPIRVQVVESMTAFWPASTRQQLAQAIKCEANKESPDFLDTGKCIACNTVLRTGCTGVSCNKLIGGKDVSRSDLKREYSIAEILY